MRRLLRVLVVDDDEEWRNLLAEILPPDEFQVDAVASAAEAKTELAKSFFHLVTLDIRLQDADESNVQGFELLQELAESGQTEATRIIVLSAFGTEQQQREAFRDHNVMDFVNKRGPEHRGFDNRAFVQGLRSAMAGKFQLNLALNIHWQGISEPEEAVQGLRVQGSRLRASDRDSPLFRRVVAELDDLLCRLFHDAEEVLLRSLERGHGGGGLLLAEPQYADLGAGQPLVIKFGDVAQIHTEAENYRTFVSGFVGGHRAAHLTNERRTPLLGGLAYSLLGHDSGRFRNFQEFYIESSQQQVVRLLETLFSQTCGNWYANVKPPELLNLTEDYQNLLGFTLGNLEAALTSRLPSVQGAERLKFEGLSGDRRFTNPLQLLNRQPIILRSCRGVTHGDLNHFNILIDDQDNAWLIDFQATGWGHFLRDFARLDSFVRFLLLKDATLDERLVLEEALGSANNYCDFTALEASFISANPMVEKAFHVSIAIRKLAADVATEGRPGDFREYHAASFFFALNWLRFYDAPRMEREHAILAASILAEKVAH